MSILGNRKRQGFAEYCAGGWHALVQFVNVVWKPVALMALGVALVIGSLGAWNTLCDSDHFMLKELQIDATPGLCKDEVAFICGLDVGSDNLLFLTEDRIEDACMQDSRIRWARAEIDLPDRVEVHVVEQVPVLYVATAFGLWSVNALGETLGPADMNDLRDLPLLLGLVDDRRTREEERQSLRDALSLVRTASQPSGPWRGQGLLIEHDPDLGYSVTGANRGPRVRFGWPPFCKKYDRLQKALDVAERESLWVREALLDNARNPNAVTLKIFMSGGLASLATEPGRGIEITGLEDDHE